jgi:hypothetical protein
MDQISKAVHSWSIFWLACAFEHGTPMFVGVPSQAAPVRAPGSLRMGDAGRCCVDSHEDGNGWVVPMLRHVVGHTF